MKIEKTTSVLRKGTIFLLQENDEKLTSKNENSSDKCKFNKWNWNFHSAVINQRLLNTKKYKH